MAVEYQYANKEQLLAAMREEFAFLESEYGYTELVERPERYINPYSVLYRKSPVEVLVEGISYGSGTSIMFRIREDLSQPPQDNFCISWITTIRRPDLQEWQFPENRVIEELEPHRDLLNPPSRKRLEIAKSRS